MPLPKLSALQAFDAAARRENFRKAAEDLHVTPGAVAQQVRQLEAQLGRALFTRHARGLRLTEAGAAYAHRLREAFALIEEATAQVQERPRLLVLSVPPSFAAKWLMPRLPGFLAAHPEVQLHTLATEEKADFSRDGVHLAIRQGRRPTLDGIKVEWLAPLNITAVAAPGLVPQGGGLAEIAQRPLIEDGHGLWAGVLAGAGLAMPSGVLRFNQTALAVEAARAGQGVALAPRLLVAREIAEGMLEEVWQASPASEEGFYLLAPEIRRAPAGRSAVSDWLRAALSA